MSSNSGRAARARHAGENDRRAPCLPQQPEPTLANPLLALQRTAGNAAVGHLIGASQAGPTTIRRDLTDQQSHVLDHAKLKAAERAKAAKKLLIKKAKSFGITPKQLDTIRDYIRKAEVTINFNAGKVINTKPLPQLLEESGEVKNLFETGSSGGSDDFKGREEVERGLLGYSKIEPTSDLAAKAERPKYAAINPTTSALGGADTSSYGGSSLVLNESVKARTTLTPSDSFAAKNPELLGTFDHIDHVLLDRFSQSDGKQFAETILEHAEGRRGQSGRTKGFGYIEGQVHGKVDLDKDVAYVRGEFREAFGTEGGEALRKLAGSKPVVWAFFGQRDEMVLQPTTGPAKAKFNAVWDEVKKQRAADSEVKLMPYWEKLLKEMPPANIDVWGPRSKQLGQTAGRGKDNPIEKLPKTQQEFAALFT